MKYIQGSVENGIYASHINQVGCPADAVQSVKEISDYIYKVKSGEGAVREFIEYLIR